jgi:hypothetical protein
MDLMQHPPHRTRMETRIVYPEEVTNWLLGSFQRDLRPNKKVRAYADKLKGEWGGVMKGIITLGKLINDPKDTTWIVDGQHRIHAFKLSELDECLVDIQTRWFETRAEMAAAYKELNSTLVRQTPDDNLRAMEETVNGLHLIRTSCPAVGYGNVRRPGNKHMISMSALLRCWAISRSETPGASSQVPAEDLAIALTDVDVRCIIQFMDMASEAWGTDREYHRLWLQLNMSLCMWLYRRLVVDRNRTGKRRVVLGEDEFRRCLMRLSSTHMYVDWLAGRTMHERERAPAYYRICDAFMVSLRADGIARPILPRPEWAMGRKS